MLAVRIGMFMWRQCKRHFVTTSCLMRGHESSKQGDVRDKAALVTGGASGIGLQCCKALLRCGCRGVTIADRDNECGEAALRELAEEFGNDKAVFVNCDVTKSEHVDWAFKTTINAFNRLDIVVNNAGVLNDKIWENEINTNICGTMVGSLLGLQYMAAHCVGHGGTVINIGSTMGLNPFGGCPIYSMTQSAILGLTRALGTGGHYDRTKVKVIALAVGLTETPLMINATKNAINSRFSNDFKKELECHKWQKPETVANALIAAIKDGESGAIWVIECGSNPYKVCIPCYYEMKHHGKESIMECETPGKRSKPYAAKEEGASSKEEAKEPAECKKDGKKDAKKEAKKEAKKDGKKDTKKEAKKADKPAAKGGKVPAAKVKAAPAKPAASTKGTKSTKQKPKAKGGKAGKRICGTCPEPKWADGVPPKKHAEKDEAKEEDEARDGCAVKYHIKGKHRKHSKEKKRTLSKIDFSGACKKKSPQPTGAAPGDKKGAPPVKVPAGKKGVKMSKQEAKKIEAKSPPKVAAKPPPKAAAKPPPPAAKAPPAKPPIPVKGGAAGKPPTAKPVKQPLPKTAKPVPPKAGAKPPPSSKSAKTSKTSVSDKSDARSTITELSFECDCDDDRSYKKKQRKSEMRASGKKR